jgi:hypothetical protein
VPIGAANLDRHCRTSRDPFVRLSTSRAALPP